MKLEQIYPELEEIKNEIRSLKILIIQSRQTPKQIVSLRGALKGIKVSEEDIEEAKKSVFKLAFTSDFKRS
ncbi:MAG: hypothetical protein DRP10_00205 [Candidatus Aenigmatarchaeota archaeon]|nr:MAG: hypothetical protein DRP10_00205 [Candidatus Aenigmarchaeota archaeon]